MASRRNRTGNMGKKTRIAQLKELHCACVIHGDKYSWTYVDRLYNMIARNSSMPVVMHVFTESKRSVPGKYIKHCLEEWPGVSGPRKSWWYKMQMFNPTHFRGSLLYFDLDVVIIDNIDWMWQQDTDKFWTVHDFRRLWRPTWAGLNSSVMFWNTEHYAWVWEKFNENHVGINVHRYHGDQDFLTAVLEKQHLRFFDTKKIRSWRWEIKDGGYDMKSRTYQSPNAGSLLQPETVVMIFHGSPKPHEIDDPVLTTHWV